jgi:hypothetical protein
MALPFEDEVLSVLYKDEIPATITGRFPEQRATAKRLLFLAVYKAAALGFRVREHRVITELRHGRLHIWLRAEAERA